MNYDNCPNCDAKIKSGFMKTLSMSQPSQTELINFYTNNTAEAYCESCGRSLFANVYEQFTNELKSLRETIKTSINAIPVISLNSPSNWDYQVVDMVTGQSVTGTGVMSEISSSFTDLFGGQSANLNNKLKHGERICSAQLRKQAIELGANAVIATDIDYSEVGSAKGMLMVCMAGTAIKLNNPSVLGSERQAQIEQVFIDYKRLQLLQSFGQIPNYI